MGKWGVDIIYPGGMNEWGIFSNLSVVQESGEGRGPSLYYNYYNIVLIILAALFSFADIFKCFIDQLPIIPVPLCYFAAICLLCVLQRNSLNRTALIIHINYSLVKHGSIPCSLGALVNSIACNGSDNGANTRSEQGSFSVSSYGLTQESAYASTNGSTFLSIVTVFWCSCASGVKKDDSKK